MPMDDRANKRAKKLRGLVASPDLGESPRRTGARHNLVPLHHGFYVAATQPVSVPLMLASVRETTRDRTVTVMGTGALWLYKAADAPRTLTVGVPLGSSFSAPPPLAVRRVAASVLEGRRTLDGCQVVALEVAVLQVAAEWSSARVRELVEDSSVDGTRPSPGSGHDAAAGSRAQPGSGRSATSWPEGRWMPTSAV